MVVIWLLVRMTENIFDFVTAVEDLERNDGTPERPYLMPESLRKILNKKNKNQPAE